MFNFMNNNYGESEYEAEEILNEFSARRVPYQASTPEILLQYSVYVMMTYVVYLTDRNSSCLCNNVSRYE